MRPLVRCFQAYHSSHTVTAVPTGLGVPEGRRWSLSGSLCPSTGSTEASHSSRTCYWFPLTGTAGSPGLCHIFAYHIWLRNQNSFCGIACKWLQFLRHANLNKAGSSSSAWAVQAMRPRFTPRQERALSSEIPLLVDGFWGQGEIMNRSKFLGEQGDVPKRFKRRLCSRGGGECKEEAEPGYFKLKCVHRQRSRSADATLSSCKEASASGRL